MDSNDDSIFLECDVLFHDVVSDPEVLVLENHRRKVRVEGDNQISQMQEQAPAEMALQDGQNPKAEVPQPSVGAQDGEGPESQTSEPLSMVQDGGESWEVQDRVLAPFLEQIIGSAPVYETPEGSSNSNTRKSPGRPPVGSALRHGNLLNQNSARKTRRRIQNFVLPPGWIKEVQKRKNGVSAGNKDTYYIETSTQHICRTQGQVVDYLANKEKELQTRNHDASSSAGVVLPPAEMDKI